MIKLKKIIHAILNELGQEVNNPVPKAVAVPSRRREVEALQQAVENVIQYRAMEHGQESLAESLDFDVPSDFNAEEPLTGYQMMIDEMPGYQAAQNRERDSERPESAGAPPIQGAGADSAPNQADEPQPKQM